MAADAPTPGTGPLLDALRDIVGPRHVLAGDDVTAGFVTDWTGRYRGSTTAVVRPADTTEVAATLQLCARAGVAVVPQGGNTGLVGGSVPHHGEVVLSLTRLDTISPVDDLAGQVTCGAGASLARLQAAARAAGWEFAVDLAARDSATVGGMVATNAGGLHVLRYGSTRRQLLGVEAVLADGRVVSRLGGLEKDNTGYDLAGLLCGSEGTLAVITAARLRLVRPEPERVTALVLLAGLGGAVRLAARARRTLPALDAAEVLEGRGLALVEQQLGLAAPFTRPVGDDAAVLLLECAGETDPAPALADLLAGDPDVLDVAVATEGPRRAALWAYRDGHSEAIQGVGTPVKLDVTLPQTRLAEFSTRVRPAVREAAPGALVWLFGHVADGNLHVNVTGADVRDEAVEDAVLGLVVDLGGSISAEHGIGVAKQRWLERDRGPASVAAMRAVKDALDPSGVLNPAVLLPPR